MKRNLLAISMMIKRVLLSFFLISFLLSCKKDDKTPQEQLPAATQEGKNTFGCLINGQLFTPKGGITVPALTATYYNGGVVAIDAVHVEPGGKNAIFLRLDGLDTPITKEGSYLLELEGNKTFVGKYTNLTNNCEMQTDSINTGMLTITRYSPGSRQGIISGTFYFTVKKAGCPDVHITDGRFDITF